ncbi:hypothetical protein MLD38_009368 [Melastoma candidum]|uniref:Uncharacterized protein n=1 Tax=Melastoma candidum TaxID=119954 RepID=A0ACB9S0D9_9MYRT|nr:hypothetical protein MLD38_009368 [Melastoma candidum]
MGGICSKPAQKSNPYADTSVSFNAYKASAVPRPAVRTNVAQPIAREVPANRSQEIKPPQEQIVGVRQGSDNDDFYDGIPRYPLQKSRSIRAQAAVAKVDQPGRL